ncbi:MAG: hypothetical protein HN849_12020, partial [Victivallales bacterium]|nr:hypothetical protein [Victivallales bacterium]
MHHEGRTRPAILALLLLAMLVATNTCLAARLRCLKCGKTIQGRYLTVGRKAYCGDSCYRKTLPKCAVCRKRISGKYVKHKARSYCSEKCVQKALPKCELCKKALREYAKIGGHVYCQTHAVGPRCDACRLPLLEGKELPDKRVLCDQCVGKIVLDAREAQSIYERAKREVAALTGLAIKPLPPMELTGREKMPARKRGVAVENVQER